ncbi:MAG: hypothetical protein Tsb0013_16470 [Phycisphaerales bacterium]
MLTLIALSSIMGMNPHQSDRAAFERATMLTRVELETPGGPLPFVLDRGRGLLYNGDKKLKVEVTTEFVREGPRIYRILFPAFDSALELYMDSGTLEATYARNRASGDANVPGTFTFVDHVHDRFDREHPLNPDAITAIDGRWVVDFANADDEALGIFEVTDEGLATGTFLTTTGDYRFLEGVVDGATLKLSCFDGGHAFLFHADLNDDGSLTGDFWSGNWYHDTWTATPAPDGFTMPDAFALTEWTGDAGLHDLAFKDLDGVERSVGEMIDGKPAIIEVFGSWCPNCHDAARAVKALHKKYAIPVVGLAFELTDDHERSVRQVRAFQRKHNAEWPVLIAGIADKADASEKLPVFDELRSYPTTVFVRADGSVAAVHTGFTGPAAREEHAAMLERWDAIVRGLVEGQ